MWIIQAALTRDTNAIVVLEKDTTVNKALWIFAPGIAVIVKAFKVIRVNRYSYDNFPAVFSMPIFRVTPEEIFSDEVPALHANFINPRDYGDSETYTTTTTDENGKEVEVEKSMNSAKNLSETIGQWYVAIRNIVLVALMVVLLYIGIRILISTAAEEKAKYLESLKNWVVALILVVFMHYIMAFAQTMTGYVTDMLRSQSTTATIVLPAEFYDQFIQKANFDQTTINSIERDIDGAGNEGGVVWQVNLMELAKIRSQLIGTDESGNQLTGLSKLGYTFIYLIFVVFTLTFVITYLKRLVYLAFLTLIAPMVALTYPIDKIKDGQAQAFGMWMKEYMFNLLLQPMHYLLYIILIGSAMDIATTNMIYAIAAMGFLMEAEQLMRKFFGFEKASTTGKVMGGVLGGALAINALQNIGKLGSGIKGGKGGSAKGGSGDAGRVKTVDPASRSADSGADDDFDSLIDGVRENGNNPPALDAGDGGDGDNNQPNMPILTDEQQESRLAELRNYRDMGFMSDEEYQRQVDRTLGINPTDGDTSVPTNPDPSNLPLPTTPTDTTIRTTNSNYKRPKGRKIRGIANVAKTYAPGIGKKVARFTAKGVGAGILGMYGLAAGVASGDSSNVLKYGAIGATAGMAVGNAGANIVGNAIQGGKDIRETYRQGAYTPDQLKAMRNAESDKAWRRNKEIEAQYKESFEKYCKKYNIENTKENYNQYRDTAMEYRKKGITDDKIITKSINATGMDEASLKQGLLLAKTANKVNNRDDLDNYRKDLLNGGLSSAQVDDIMKNVRKIKDI